MSLTVAELASVARLAQLGLDENELAALTEDVGRILELVEEMQAIDTDGVVPMAHPANAILSLRADVVSEASDRENLQRPAPAIEDGYFLVPRVIE